MMELINGSAAADRETDKVILTLLSRENFLALVINNSKGFYFGQLEMGELIKQNLEGLIKFRLNTSWKKYTSELDKELERNLKMRTKSKKEKR